MLKVENTEVFGWEAAIRGMRNPKNSWSKSDSYPAVDCDRCGVIEREGYCKPKEHNCSQYECYQIGINDLKLMQNLSKAGNDHAKFLRMINVTCDIIAPLYWWKEYDTYKVGTVANSCSTMHKIHTQPINEDAFSFDHVQLCDIGKQYLEELEKLRLKFLDTNNKEYWYALIQLLPESYNQRRTVQLNYQVLKNMYFSRHNHKLDEWHTLCNWMLTLPYFKEICLGDKNE